MLTGSVENPPLISEFIQKNKWTFKNEFSTLEVHLGSPFNWHEVTPPAACAPTRVASVARVAPVLAGPATALAHAR